MEQHHTEPKESSKFLIPAAIIVAGALVAGAIYAGGTKAPVTRNQQPTNTEVKIVPVSNEDHIVGSRNAKVVIVEYSDTECPFCKVFHGTMRQIVTQYD